MAKWATKVASPERRRGWVSHGKVSDKGGRPQMAPGEIGDQGGWAQIARWATKLAGPIW